MAKDIKFYRSREIPGLSVQVKPADPDKGEVQPHNVSFEQFYERYAGETVRVGYLMTDDARAIEILDADANVEKIDQEEYEKRTNLDDSDVRKVAF